VIADTGITMITYTFTDANGCNGSDSTGLYVDICSGISVDDASVSIHIYPNPNNGVFTLSISMNSDGGVLEIMDVLGQSIYEEIIAAKSGKAEKTISLAAQANGIYFARLTTKGQTVVQKIILQK
ncbi:MAG TPA: T9SS type A sorting domain-containing protein, partial [Bacteroidia bacterium]|nr:T9SS type A sorting domain-containing protein [Bacteroidia bacterium]